jgi:hypothetical protein
MRTICPAPGGAPPPTTTDAKAVELELERILRSRIFASSRRSQRFLRYVVERSIGDGSEPIKEYAIALDVFERDASYDPLIDATVRVEAGRLRSRLREYYADEGKAVTGKASIGLAVMPFVNRTGDAGNDYLAEGLTENLIRQFSEVARLKVMARSAVDRVAGKPGARALGVDDVLTGD